MLQILLIALLRASLNGFEGSLVRCLQVQQDAIGSEKIIPAYKWGKSSLGKSELSGLVQLESESAAIQT